MVVTDAEELVDADLGRFESVEGSKPSSFLSRFRPLSFSDFASCSSAIPFLEDYVNDYARTKDANAYAYFLRRSWGTSLFNFGTNFGLSNCWVRDGRET
jgi:hypothetical protein